MPDVARVLELFATVGDTDVAEPHALAGGQVADAQDQRFKPRAASGNLVERCQRFDIFDEHFDADSPDLEAELCSS